MNKAQSVTSPSAEPGADYTVTVPRATPKPIEGQQIPQNPHMAPNGRNNVHNDSYMSDTYDLPGPIGGRLRVRRSVLPGLPVSMTFDSKGRINVLAIGSISGTRTLHLVDAVSLSKLASFDLPSSPDDRGWGGGGYFYMDAQERLVVPTITRQIWIVELKDPTEPDTDPDTEPHTGPYFEKVKVYDLDRSMPDPDDSILSVLPDWSGNLWFVSMMGVVGYIDYKTEQVHTYRLMNENPTPKPKEVNYEVIANSFVTDETGGVFVVSDHALYRFEIGASGSPEWIWRVAYDRGHRRREKPGQVSIGSGTTPTLLNIGDAKFVSIADNADPQMHVLVFRRESIYKDKPEEQKVCEQAVFDNYQGCTDNSLISVGNAIIVENNYGYRGPQSTAGPLVTEPGIARIDFDEQGSGSRVVWINPAKVPSVVSKLCLANGLVYTYTKQRTGWYFTAIDFEQGAIVFEVSTGSSELVNSHYAGLYIGPGSRAYVGVLGGIVSISQD